MVDRGELAFRLLCRRWGVHLCYTPMMNARNFLESRAFRERVFATCAADRPLVVQFAGHDPAHLVAAARLVQDRCDAVDLNLGCPQRIAHRGGYGAFLMDELDLVARIVRALDEDLSVPVFCKIRIFSDRARTVAFARHLESAGAQLVAVHGRERWMKGGYHEHPADWDVIRAVREALSVPVIANGNIGSLDDAQRCIAELGVAGVMSAGAILGNPALFFEGPGPAPARLALAHEYLDLAEVLQHPISWTLGHVFSMLRHSVGGGGRGGGVLVEHSFYRLSSIADVRKMLAALEKAGPLATPPSHEAHGGAGVSGHRCTAFCNHGASSDEFLDDDAMSALFCAADDEDDDNDGGDLGGAPECEQGA